MESLISESLLEIVASVALIVATAIGAWVGKGKKAALDSEAFERSALAATQFSPAMYRHLRAAADAAMVRVADELDRFEDNDVYEYVRDIGLIHANNLAEKAGFRRDLLTDEDIDAMAKAAISEARQAYRAAQP